MTSATPLITLTKEEVAEMTPEVLVDQLIDDGFPAFDMRKIESKQELWSNPILCSYNFRTNYASCM